MEMSMNIAVIGLGRVGSVFLANMMKQRERGVTIAAVAEIGDTPGRAAAMAAGIPVSTAEAVVASGPAIDVIFDTTGDEGVRRMLREHLRAAGNEHTVIAPETVTRLIWQLIGEGPLPDVHKRIGY
jgi:predicted dinucleotide-utilizing enzyme